MIYFLKTLGFIFGWLAPFGCIYVNHVVLIDGGYDVDMFGLLLVLALIIGFVKWVDKKVEVWTIQDKQRVFVLIWNNSKKILLAISLTWILYTIEDDIAKIQITALLISACFVIGFVFSLLGELKHKAVSKCYCLYFEGR